MATIPLHTKAGQEAGSVDLDDAIFGAPINVPAMHQVVTAQLANARTGSAKTKTRAEVAGGGKKPWRQKGTGRARQGSIRAPHFTGGGVAHGRTGKENFSKRVNKQVKRIALRSALSDRAASGDIRVLSDLSFDAPRTKDAIEVLAGLGLGGRKVLLVLASQDVAIGRSFRNLRDVHMLTVDQLNTYDVLCSDVVVFQQDALELIGTGERTDLRRGPTLGAEPATAGTAGDEPATAGTAGDEEVAS